MGRQAQILVGPVDRMGDLRPQAEAMPSRDDRPPVVPRVHRVSRNGAPHHKANEANEQGLTVTHLLTAVVAMGVAIVVLFLAIKPSRPDHSATTKATVVPTVQPVLDALQHDVDGTVHAILLDTDGCGHAKGQRAVVSFLADGSAPERASWYVEMHDGDTQLVRRDCRNGALVASGVVTAVTGRPLVACTPSCGRFQQIRFSYDGPTGLTNVVAYRSGPAR